MRPEHIKHTEAYEAHERPPFWLLRNITTHMHGLTKYGSLQVPVSFIFSADLVTTAVTWVLAQFSNRK